MARGVASRPSSRRSTIPPPPHPRLGRRRLAAGGGHGRRFKLSHAARQAAELRRLAVTIQCESAVAVTRRGRDTALAEALATVAEAVARETGCAVVITTTVDDDGVVWRVRPEDTSGGATAAEPFDRWRAGLGVRLVTAVTLIEASGGSLTDLRVDGARAGVDVRLPRAATATATP